MAARKKAKGARKCPKVEDTKAIVKRGEKALAALWLSAVTQVDKVRCSQVERAFRAIDREQAAFKEKVDGVLEEAQHQLNENSRLPPNVSAELLDLHVGLLDKLEAILAPTRITPEKT